MTQRHNERCHDCKKTVQSLLAARFGRVECAWDLNLPCEVADYANTALGDVLSEIHGELQSHRGFRDFVRSKKLKPVDFFVPDESLIVEFDESQHFTRPREISLSLYARGYRLGFDVDKWRTLCRELDSRDNDPPFRDEQRAWYDTLRDFAPMLLGAGKTIRLYSRDCVWCSLNPTNDADQHLFNRLFSVD